jgi:hypothetical protein
MEEKEPGSGSVAAHEGKRPPREGEKVHARPVIDEALPASPARERAQGIDENWLVARRLMAAAP